MATKAPLFFLFLVEKKSSSRTAQSKKEKLAHSTTTRTIPEREGMLSGLPFQAQTRAGRTSLPRFSTGKEILIKRARGKEDRIQSH